MTTPMHTFMDLRDAAPAIYNTGRSKNNVVVDEDLSYKNVKYFGDLMNQMDRQSTEMSKDNTLRQRAAYTEAIMSDELRKLKHKEFIDRKRRQQLRNDCEELRVLAEQLRLASITKDLKEYILVNNKSRQLAKNAHVEGLQRAEAERQKQLAKELEHELHKKEQQQELREALSTQIEEGRKRRQEQYVVTLADREEQMAIQRQIDEEDKLEQEELERLKKNKRNEMIEIIQQHREYKELQQAKSNVEMEKILKIQLEMSEQKEKTNAARKEAQRKQEEISLRIGHQVFEVENQKRQRNNLLLDLLQAEFKAKNDERYRQQLEKEELERRRARMELERYRAEIAERSMEQARLKLAQEFDKNLECTNGQEIKEKELQERLRRKEHGALLLSMIEENHRKRAEAAAENMQFFDSKAKSEAELQERIREERLQMLGSVPPSVLQYLPKQVLSNSDRQYFNIQKETAKTAAAGQ